VSLPESRIETYRESLKYSLKARFFLRFHAGLIILWTSLITWGADVVMLKCGALSMLVRYPLAIMVGYAAFLIGVKVWLGYSGIREYLNQRDAEELVKSPQQEVNQRDYFDWSLDTFSGDAEGCLAMIVVAVAALLTFWLLGAFATQLFADVVLEVILAAGLLKGLRKTESSGWLTGAWGSTKYWLLFVLVAAVIFAAWAHVKYPDSTTASQVLNAKNEPRFP